MYAKNVSLAATLLLFCLPPVEAGLSTEPPLSAASADTPWRFVGISTETFCPEPTPGGGTTWNRDQLFKIETEDTVPVGLERYCLYSAADFDPVDGPNIQRIEDLRCTNRTPPCLSALSKDSLSVARMGNPPQQLDQAMAAALRAHLHQQAGRFTRWSTDQRVRLAFVDTEPTGPNQDLNGPGNAEHGFSLMSAARDLLCESTTGCGIEFVSELGLPRVPCDSPIGFCVDVVDGGYVGTIGDVARAIRAQTRKWIVDGSNVSLIINLSLGWDPLFNLDANGNPRASTLAVLGALEDATCRGAIVIASAGNGRAGLSAPTGPLYPAAWERLPAPSLTDCETLIGTPIDPTVFGTPGAYRPLVYAAGAVDTFDRFVTPRAGGAPRLVAFGDHAVTNGNYGGPIAPTATLTGTSVSAMVVSAAAAAAWYHRRDLAGWEVMNLVHRSGQPLTAAGAPTTAEFCFNDGAGCPELHRIQICDAARLACTEAPGGCPPLSCPPRHRLRPQIDVADIVSRFAGARSFIMPDSANQATIAGCGPGYTLHWASGPVPAVPCPHRQFHAIQSTPWTDSQPSGVACPLCSGASESPGVVYIEIDRAFGAELGDLTLICGGDPMLDPGPFDAFRIEAGGTLSGGEMFKIDNVAPLCENDDIWLAATVIGDGPTPASTLNVVYYATDRDNDGVKDTLDNCEVVANDQTDTDADRIGNHCDPDIARPNDCIVNFLDLVTMRNAFFATPGDTNWNADADFDVNGIVNFRDAALMQRMFFGTPGPSGLPEPCS